MAAVLSGKEVAQAIREDLLQKMKESGIQPKLGIIRVGERPDDLSYETRVKNNCEKLGISCEVFVFPEEIGMQDFTVAFDRISQDEKNDAILMFRPLPSQLDEGFFMKRIPTEKDVDCMNPENLNRIFQGEKADFFPCTPEAVLEILKYYQVPIQGSKVVIVNRSMVLGKPLSMMLLKENGTVTICHSKTRNLEKITQDADILITGIGRAEFFDKEYISEKSVIIDVGINFLNGKMTGDVVFQDAEDVAAGITPVPGGVGVVTSMILLKHVVLAAEGRTHG